MKNSILLLAFISSLASAQDNTAKQQPFQTAIFIHTSKPQYLSGEKIWLSAYLFNASTQQLLVHKHPLYVQLYASDGKLMANEVLYTEAGRGSGAVALLPSTPPGIYRLQAFTQSMVMNKQPSYEQRIYVGSEPTMSEQNNKTKAVDLLEISTDSPTYSQRSPVQLFLQSDSTLEATLSVSVYKETTSQSNTLIFPSKTATKSSESAEGLFYMGRAMKANGSAITRGQVVLSLNLPDGQKTSIANIDSVGFFIFNDLYLEGEQTAYWQVNDAKGRPLTNTTIHWIKFPRISLKIDSLVLAKESISVLQQPAVFKSDGDSLSFDAQMLAEVTIKAKKQEPVLFGLPVLHKDTDVSFAVNLENNQLLPNGYSGGEHNLYKMIKMYLPSCAGSASDPPKYLIDGVVADKPEEFLDLRQIKRIELLRGANAMIYGSSCVYAIYTFGVEKYTKKSKPTPEKTLKLQGYQPIQAFYSPNYDNKTQTEQDNRQTLYWNPALVLEPKQKDVSIRFFSSDMNGTYRVVVQGISNLGAVYAETSFRVD